MKQLSQRTLAVLMFGVILLLPSLSHAQAASRTIRVNIPFEFTVGDSVLPAGSYSLVRPIPHYVQLRDDSGRVVASSITNAVESYPVSDRSTLKFQVVDGQHMLAEVWHAGDQAGEELVGRNQRAVMAGKRSVRDNKAEEGQP